MTFLSFPFPIITAIICVVKYRKTAKDALIILVTLVISFASIITASIVFTYSQQEKYYDKDGTKHTAFYKVSFIDTDGNRYAFDFDKSGYDKFYINNTEEYLNADLCYVDSNGYFYYDDDISITAKDESCCIDQDGSIYYPAKFTSFNSDGTIKYSYNSDNFKFDRFGNAYTFNYVPFYDEDGSKYIYTFDSFSQKGFYTNVVTKETFDNEYSFVDENGYFVYDEKHSFVRQKNSEIAYTYKDLSDKTYYWASNVSWDKEGNLFDSFGKEIKQQ